MVLCKAMKKPRHIQGCLHFLDSDEYQDFEKNESEREKIESERECRVGSVKRRLPWIQFPAIRAQSISKSPLHWCRYISSIAMHYNAHSALSHASHYVRSCNCRVFWHKLVHCWKYISSSAMHYNAYSALTHTCLALCTMAQC